MKRVWMISDPKILVGVDVAWFSYNLSPISRRPAGPPRALSTFERQLDNRLNWAK
jgi:hypothetical protein